MARPAKPRQGETLAKYLDRLLVGRSVNGLARELSADDGSSKETWERKLRRWTAGPTGAISDENAATLTRALNADFSPFIRGQNGTAVRDLMTQALDRIEALEARLADLEQP